MNGKLFPTEEELCAAKILVVDDEEADIRALQWAFRKSKFPNYRSLTDSTRALTEFQQFQPDIVLLDLNMPQLDGFAVLKQIKSTLAEGEFLPVLVLTGENTTETRIEALAGGASDFLGKPIDYTEVMLRVRNLLQTRFLYRQAKEMKSRLENLSPKTPA